MAMPSTANRKLNAYFSSITTLLCLLWTAALTGCADGPLYQMKKLSPWHQREWMRDRELGPTYAQRLEEMKLLESQLATMGPEEKEKWGSLLERMATKDTSPEIRCRAVVLLASVESDTATRALNVASTDEIEKVRLSACKAWSSRKSPEARDMLLSMVAKDDSPQVKQAAIAGLAEFKDPEVVKSLVKELDDNNPAIQYQTVLALKSMTGRDYGGDFDAWRRYVDGEDVPLPNPPTMTARIMNSLPWMK